MTGPSRVRLGVVQPHSYGGEEAPKMLEGALEHVEEAGHLGVGLLVFPETYPGPVSWHTRYEVVEPLREAAAKHGVGLVVGTTEPVEDSDDDRAFYIAGVVIDGSGEVVGRYRRTHPRSDYYRGLYATGPFWEFHYTAADELPVFDMGWGKLAVGICSEVYVPELARSFALQGAEVCVFPTGAMIPDLSFDTTWQTLLRARAIENVMYTATTVNLFDADLRARHNGGPNLPPIDPATGLNNGHAMICSPERVMGTMRGKGILTADLDLEYVRRMRADLEFPDGIEVPPPYVSLPGVFNMCRPDVTGDLRAVAAETAETRR